MNPKDFKAKIEYYVISLSFTVLAVAVQTVGAKTIYKFNDETFKSILYHYEFPSWICFALSGSLGIIKMLQISKLLYLNERQSKKPIESQFGDESNHLIKIIHKLEVIQYTVLFSGFFLMIISRIFSFIKM